MSSNRASLRTALIVVSTLLATAGLCASFAYNWHGASIAWTAAFICKWIECWLLEKTLVECQEARP